MRASSPYRPLVYVVEPQQRMYDQFGVHLRDSEPFRIEFRGHREGFFDSSLIADPQKRKRAEEFLINHPDRGKFFHIERETPTKDTKKAKTKGCIATLHVKGQPASVCGKAVVDGLDYCEDCAETETAVA